MTRLPDNPEPVVYFQEKHKAPAKVLVQLFLGLGAVYFLVPVLIVQVVTWSDASFPSPEVSARLGEWVLISAALALVMAVLGAINNRRTFTVDSQAVRVPYHAIPLETIIGWRRLDGDEVRRKRRELLRKLPGNHPMILAAWGLRGGRWTAFAPPWIPTAILIDHEDMNAPTLIGTHRPEEFLAALESAVGPVRERAKREAEADGRRIRENVPPEIREAARRTVDGLMPRHSSNGQFHGHHRKQPEQQPPR